jgi:putative addiction module component (TIGR02574 family)
MKLAELPQVMALSTEEKLELIEDLWISLEPKLEQLDVSEEEKKLLDERWEKFLANPGSALTMDQVEALLAARRKR